jgi:Ca2+/Na+ antiporter
MSCVTGGPFGAFPDCEGLGASVFLNVVYGYGLLQAAQLISDGSELLLEILSPGLVGGLLLPILGAVPDAAVIVASGLGASREEAQEQVSVGMGTLAGSTVMLLTIAWGGSLWVGRCDLDEFTGRAVPKTLSHRGLSAALQSLGVTGVTTDRDTKLNAKIMMASCLLFLIVQVPALMGDASDARLDLVGGVCALVALACYCAFQVLHPELQRRKIEAAKLRHAKKHSTALAHHIGVSVGGILVDGDINAAALDRLFDQFDADGNGEVDTAELKAALVAISVTMQDYNVTDSDVAVWLREFDRDGDGLISRSEFCAGMTHWVLEQTKRLAAAPSVPREERISTIAEGTTGLVSTRSQRRGLSVNPSSRPGGAPGLEPLLGGERGGGRDAAGGELDGLESEDEDGEEEEEDDDDDVEEPPTTFQIVRKSALLLTLGMVLVALLADPMVGAVTSLSKAAGLPSPFFASFVLTPFASNASELVSSLYFASKKRKKNISLTYSQVYGAVTMNNTMCLGLFMIVMHARGLEWEFTSETLTILLVTLLVGALGASRTTFKTSWVVPVLAVYPLSLAFVVFLDFVVGLK